MASLSENSGSMDVLAITIANPAVSIQCGAAGTTNVAGAKLFAGLRVRSCLVRLYSGTGGYMAIRKAATAAATSWVINSTAIPVPVNDLADLNFIGTAGDVIQIIYRV